MQEKYRVLFNLDASLRREADRMLAETGLGTLVYERGYRHVGSYVMRTMVWRDLDFERSEDPPDWQKHLEFGWKLMQLGWAWEYDCMNTCITTYFPDLPKGYYWGLRGEYPQGGQTWKIDLWTARAEEFERSNRRMASWMSKLSDETRFDILAIKDALCHTLEYRRTIHSVDIYEAVLDCGVQNLEEFKEWWRQRYGK